MKKIKNVITIILLIALMFLPDTIFAQSYEEHQIYKKTLTEVETFLNELDNVKEENGEYTIELPIVKPELLYKNGLLNLDEYKIKAQKMYPEEYETYTEEELIALMNQQNDYIKLNSVWGAIVNYFRSIGLEENEFTISFDCDPYTNTCNFNSISLSIHYLSENNEELNYQIEFKTQYLEEVDNEILNKAQEISEKIEGSYEISDMALINSVYHYGTWVDMLYNNSLALYQYPELKEILEQNKEFEFKPYSEGGGGTVILESADGFISIIKDGVTYSSAYTTYLINLVMYVDKDLEGTPKEKLINRIDDYFNGKVEYEITDYNGNLPDMYYELDGQKYPITVVNIKIGNNDSMLMFLSIIEVDKKYIKQLEIDVKDYDTDVNISTKGYEVPVDATLEVESKKNDKNIISLLNKYNYKMLDAYNIDIIKTRSNGKVTQIEDGVEVFIPIKDYKVGDVITIRHIKEDGTLGEVLNGTVTEKDGKLYVKFKTTHFSTYALVDEEIKSEDENQVVIKPDEDDEEVPQTYDGIYNSMILGVIGLIGLFAAGLVNNKIKTNE